ncbi:MAG: VWA domain-containing protein [Pseudomonadota bacterium]
MIELAFPWALLLLPAPWLVWRFLPPYRRASPGLRVPFFRDLTDAAGAPARTGAVVLRRRRLQMLAAMLVWTLLVAVLARPERVGDPVELSKSARDLVLAIDISGSMDERDFRAGDGPAQQRLAAVTDIVGRFVEAREGDRVALIVFGSRAFMQTPFTEDLASVGALLESTEVGMAGPHTALGDAIGLAIRAFETSEVDEKLLILLSDGADTASRMSPVNAAEIAAQAGIEIYTIGIGDPEGADEAKLDLDALKDIASRARGQFFFAEDATALDAIYARIDRIAPAKAETIRYRPREPLGGGLLGLALVVLLLATAALLAARRLGARPARSEEASA